VTRTAQTLALILWFAGGCSRKAISTAAEAGPAPSAVASAKPLKAPAELSLFYSSDARGGGAPAEGATGVGGLARRATFVDRARIEAGAVLQVDAGDLVAVSGDRADLDTPEKVEQRTRLLFASYQRMGVDVVTLGERELAIAPARLRKILSAAPDVAVVAANVVDKKGDHPFPTDKLIAAGGRSIGVFGILDPPPDASPTGGMKEIVLTDPVVASRQAVEALRSGGARLVVGLFHVAGGLAKTKEILAQVNDIDVVVLGHGAEGMEAGSKAIVGKTRVVYAEGGAGQVGRLDVRSLDGASEPDYDDQRLALPSSIPAQVGVDLLFQLDKEPVHEPSTTTADGRQIFENWTYGSNGACVLCHPRAVEQWKTTDHAHALATLKKGGHDHDRECIGCHTTGYLLAGGTRRVKTAVDQFSDVGCECCHGPSVNHIRSLNKKKGTSRKVDPSLCLGCHTIDRNGDLFDAAAAMKDMIGPGHGAPP
jgi:hypothetical protein